MAAERREAHISQAIRYVNGTRAAERMTIGICATRQSGPKTAMKPAATMEVSGIQWPLLGTGSIGSAGRRPPTSRKLHRTGTLKPCPSARRSATSW